MFSLKHVSGVLLGFSLVLGSCGNAGETSGSAITQGSETVQLLTMLDALQIAMDAGDTDRIFELTSTSAMREEMLNRGGITDPAKRAEALKQGEALGKATLANATYSRHIMDTDNIRYETSKGGGPVAFIPVTLTLEISGIKLDSVGHYIGIYRDGEWLLTTPTDKNALGVIRSAFPELDGLDVPLNAAEATSL